MATGTGHSKRGEARLSGSAIRPQGVEVEQRTGQILSSVARYLSRAGWWVEGLEAHNAERCRHRGLGAR